MKTISQQVKAVFLFCLAFTLCLALTAGVSQLAQAQDAASTTPLQVSDVIRATQMGTGTVPVGAPGNGRYIPPAPANPSLPTLWLIGDSTVRNGTLGDNGPTGQWGWGAPLPAFFDAKKINVVNRAFGGTSSRTFYSGFFWKNLRPQIKKGDFVIMQFGANDNGGAKGKGGLSGIGDETQMNNNETVHTFGWYLKQFVAETRAQNAMPIICSLTPRKHWSADGKQFTRDNGTHAAWAEQVAKETNTPFVPLYDIIAARYEKLGTKKVDTLYIPSPTEKLHTGWEGAVINAECVVSGLKALPINPLAAFFRHTPAQSRLPAALRRLKNNHVQDLPTVQPLAVEIPFLESEPQRLLDDDSPVAKRALGEAQASGGHAQGCFAQALGAACAH